MNERKMRYVGPAPGLFGKTALVLPAGARLSVTALHHGTCEVVHTDEIGVVVAQFDDLSLEESYGWHGFPTYEFVEIAT